MNPLLKIRQGFQHGVHPHPYRDQTSGLHTQRIPFGSHYVLPLTQHIGAPARCIVEVGQRVRRGQRAAVQLVLAGPFTSRDAADKAVQTARQAGFPEAVVLN